MKKWGAELFGYITIIKIGVQLLVDDFGFASGVDAFFSIVFSIVFLCFYRRMGRDL